MFAENKFSRTRCLKVSEFILEVHASSDELYEALTDSLSQLPNAIGLTDIHVFAWSEDDAGRPFPDPPRTIQIGHRGEIENLLGERYKFVFHSHSQVLIAVDCQKGIVLIVARKRSALLGIDCAAPLRVPLSWILPNRGIAMVHAGAISKNGEAILLAGRSGAGKSSLSYKGIQFGWKFMGDDLVAISGFPKPRVFNLYSTVKLFTDSVDPMLQGTSIEKWREKDGKTVFRLDLLNSDVFAQVAELSAVVLVDRSLKSGVIEETSTSSVVSIIGASTHHLIPSSSKDTFTTLIESIRFIKCWRFHPDDDVKSYKLLESILE